LNIFKWLEIKQDPICVRILRGRSKGGKGKHRQSHIAHLHRNHEAANSQNTNISVKGMIVSKFQHPMSIMHSNTNGTFFFDTRWKRILPQLYKIILYYRETNMQALNQFLKQIFSILWSDKKKLGIFTQTNMQSFRNI
jgi:hypothetical protein